MAELFAVPRREQRIFLHRTCSLDNFTDQQVVNRYRLDRVSIVDIERGYATSEFATKTRRSNAVNAMTQVILQHRRFAFGKLSKRLSTGQSRTRHLSNGGRAEGIGIGIGIGIVISNGITSSDRLLDL